MEFWDNYEHGHPKLTYILESIRSQEIEELVTHEFSGCECENECSLATCSCMQRSGTYYSFSNKFQLENYVLTVANNNKPVYECNNNCKCKNTVCGNKLVQFGPRKNLNIVNKNGKGLGLITKCKIEKGNFICEYAGEVINLSEAHKRFKMYNDLKLNHNYIFCINENFGDNNKKTFVDPTFYGNIGRYINHCCQPNCILVPIRVHDIIPKLCIFAKETIDNESEITFDYGEVNTCDDHSNKKMCLCLSENCRKYLPFDETI